VTAPIRTEAKDASTTVAVALGTRSYDIVIGRGLLASLGARIAALRPGARAYVVTDENVARYYIGAVKASLDQAGVAMNGTVVAPGESSKSYRVFEQVCEAIIASHIERGDLVIVLGGGVIGDLAGFAAAVVRRGLDYVQVPTTLLAQVDSSVGGKTAIDSAHGKNLIGAFHQPILVVADTALLDTLPEREFRAGYAELVKYGLLGDAAFFSWLEKNWREIFTGGNSSGSFARDHAIAVACRAKAAIVARDEREAGDRALLNLGHTFGHALEAACGFSDRLLHGEAIAAGMALAFEFSARRQGLVSKADAARVIAHLAETGLPTRLKDISGPLPSVDQMMELIAQDKKVKRGMLTFILLRGIGAAFVEAGVEPREVRAFLSEKLAER
jgi:3-dehydroquinate synthase